MKKVLFLFKVNNVVDVITNSSSELFVLKGETKEIVEEMIKNVFPDYLDEYDMLSHISELSTDELDNYLSYMCSPHCWPATKSQYPVPDGFTFDELYEPETDWKTGEQSPPAWNGELQYRLRNNSGERWGGLVTEENKEEIIKKLDPKGETYFLYSLDENPNWENQEKLMMIGERYHLG